MRRAQSRARPLSQILIAQRTLRLVSPPLCHYGGRAGSRSLTRVGRQGVTVRWLGEEVLRWRAYTGRAALVTGASRGIGRATRCGSRRRARWSRCIMATARRRSQRDNHLLIDRIWPGDLRPDGSALNGALIIRKWEMAMFADGLACRVPSAYEPGGRFGTSRLD